MPPIERRWRPRDGVNLAGYFLAESGVGEHARTLLATLDEASVPVAPVLFGETRSRQLAMLPQVEWMGPVFPVSIVCVNADQTPLFFERHPEVRDGRYTIGYWHWEVEEFPDAMAASACFVDEIWTASEHSRAAIARKVDRPVKVIPPAVDPPAPEAAPPETIPTGSGLLFLCCFDFDSVVVRKNPHGVIDAFRRAFPSPSGGHRLLVKSVNGSHHPDLRVELERYAQGRPDIHFFDGFLSRSEQSGLIHACDVFVSLHRSEGFGLMLAEAMAAGKLVIATDYAGSREFLDESTGWLVPWRYEQIPDGAGPYTGRWAEADLEVAARWITRAPLDREGARATSERARRLIQRAHGPAPRAAQVLERLGQIEASPPPGDDEPAPSDSGAREDLRQRIAEGPGGKMPRRWFDRLRLTALAPFWRFQRDTDLDLIDAIGASDARLALEVRDLRHELLRSNLLAAGQRRRDDRRWGACFRGTGSAFGSHES